ncbi:HAD-IIA family hydrolase [Cohnella zeiphila]|uniref:Acid sugar phosphatase n=1 Tax=Cohnella zeiphila TaxID=2761120 RepID=A0A7X0SI77_9BACL|nr:HAD-IIA family hydrolase [Cohnella zeiphila]MBB6730346.1 HAD-IIA family hydrolase [Cohnella zeiphila]
MLTWPHNPPALRKPKALLLDLDGTLYRGEEPVPGAGRLVRELEALGLPCWFVTNNSTRTPLQVAEHLRSLGIPAAPEQVATSAQATAEYARERYPNANVYVMGEHGLREAMREAGFEWEEGRPAKLVVQGIDRQLTYDRLAEAQLHLANGAAFVVTNPDRQLPVAGRVLPGAGSIAAALEAASGVRPTIVGKPSPILMDFALKRAGVSAEDAWVVGDNPRTDIAAGLAIGSPAVLVLTGLCSAEDWRQRCDDAGAMPDAVCRGLAELEQYVKSVIA